MKTTECRCQPPTWLRVARAIDARQRETSAPISASVLTGVDNPVGECARLVRVGWLERACAEGRVGYRITDAGRAELERMRREAA